LALCLQCPPRCHFSPVWTVHHGSRPTAATCTLITTSNFFELAVADPISLIGLGLGAALATVVGELVEVPVMLTLVAITIQSKGAMEARATGT
jgi:ACR3 family arsenite transporter